MAPDNTTHIVTIPYGHWLTLDWLVADGFIELQAFVKLAWDSWNLDLRLGLDTTFQTVIGFGIQEADIQYEYWINGFAND